MLSLKDCLTRQDNWGGRIDTPEGPLYYHDNGNQVLGVAHLDSVLWAKPVKSGSVVFAPQLDDRLGVWCLLNYLPSLGVSLDVLLTENEEQCNSTGAWFSPPRQYNWIVEFDRAGTDVVFYQYRDKSWRRKWQEHFRGGRGSYSDIVSMWLGCQAANLGIGYHNQHTRYCCADLEDTKRQCVKFSAFWDQYKDTYFPGELVGSDEWDKECWDKECWVNHPCF
jgi:hypothetical protein